MNKILQYYENYDENFRLEKTNSNKIEFISTLKILDSIIKPADRIADIGAGTGAYSFYCAEKSEKVISIDLVPNHVDIIKHKIEIRRIHNVKAFQGNALDLSQLKDDEFDVVLCLGPLYHLSKKEERDQCLKECYRILKPNGYLLTSYINKIFIISLLMFENNKNINSNIFDFILKKGYLPEELEKQYPYLKTLNFLSPKEIEEIINLNNFEIINHIGLEGIFRLFQEKINSLNKDDFDNLLKYHFKTFEDPTLLGYSNHGLCVSRKKEKNLKKEYFNF